MKGRSEVVLGKGVQQFNKNLLRSEKSINMSVPLLGSVPSGLPSALLESLTRSDTRNFSNSPIMPLQIRADFIWLEEVSRTHDCYLREWVS
jgi:hypothetical protein